MDPRRVIDLVVRRLSLRTMLALALCAGTAAAQEASNAIEEIIVTPTKRPRDIQDVPVAVTAVTGRMIEATGMETIQRLTDLEPSVKFDQAHSFQNASLKIRGIGTIGVSRTFEGAVGVFVDDVYRSRSGMALFDLLDIDQVEIMRGPQGTLFGKNTSAGAIVIQSNRPALEETYGQVELRAGNMGNEYLTGMLNAPLGERTALRIAGLYHERDGSFQSPDSGANYDAVDRHAFKTQLALHPTSDLEVVLFADYAKSDADCCWASAQVVNGPTAPIIAAYSALNGLTFTPAPSAEQNRAVSLNSTPRESITDQGVGATIDLSVASGELKSVTAFREWRHNHINGDPDYTPADLFTLNEPAAIDNFSQELNFTRTVGSTDLLLGLYYGNESYDGSRSVDTGRDADNYLNALISASAGAVACVPPLVAADCLFPVGVGALLPVGELTREYYEQDSDTYALFGHTTTPLTAAISLDAGLRYSVENKDGGVDNAFWYDSAIVRAVRGALGIPDDGTPRNGLDLVGTEYSPSFQDSTRDEQWTGTVALQFRPKDDSMYYVTYQRGYKAGGVNLYREAILTETTTYDPEFADSFEFGAKLSYWDRRARTNIALFRTEFSDLQINFFDGLNFRTENTGEALSQGVEIENEIHLSNEFRLDVSATYLDSKFKTIDDPLLAYLIDRDTPRAPRWAAVAQLSYEKQVGGHVFVARGMASYTGAHFVGADTPTEEKVDSYVIADFSVGMRSVEHGWDVFVWCTNCGDETYRTIYFNSTFQPGSFNAFLNQPRLYGITLRKSF